MVAVVEYRNGGNSSNNNNNGNRFLYFKWNNRAWKRSIGCIENRTLFPTVIIKTT